jgi:hypothetical protein
MIPLEKNKCVVVLKAKKQYTPVVGINQTTGGYFLNYYLDKYDPWYGDNPHVSRHEKLSTFRYDKDKDWFSTSEDIKTIDERVTPEDLPCCSITSDLYLSSVDKEHLKRKVSLPLYVPFKKCRHGVMVRVKIWPKHLSSNIKKLKEVWQEVKGAEIPVVVFTPSCFTNKVSVAVFSTDKRQIEAPFPIDEPLKGPGEGPPIAIRGPRKGRK